MQLSFTAHYSPSILLNQIIPVKKPQTIVLNTLNWQRVEIITFGISWIELEKAWKLQRWSTKKEIFKGGVGKTFLCNHTCYDLQFFQNFREKPTKL